MQAVTFQTPFLINRLISGYLPPRRAMAHSDNSSLSVGDSLESLPMADPNAALRVDRFRALIIGRANAGKTTILKAICASDQDPTVRDDI